MAAIAEFIAPFLFGVAVATTIGKGVIEPSAISPIVVLAAVIASFGNNVAVYRLETDTTIDFGFYPVPMRVSIERFEGFVADGRAPTVLYGFASLFLIGFLWAAVWGAGTALPAFLSREGAR